MIEAYSPLWFIAFSIDVILGCIAFYFVNSKIITEQYCGVGWWMGWWAFAGAITLILNAYMGTDYFWSYHQNGIISDTAINLGLIYFLLVWYRDNWALNDSDWDKIKEIRKLAKIREISK